MKTCTFPSCTAQRTGARFCKEHLKDARRWLKEQRQLDRVSEPAGAFVTHDPLYPDGPTYPWADWDWNDPLHRKPRGLETVAESVSKG